MLKSYSKRDIPLINSHVDYLRSSYNAVLQSGRFFQNFTEEDWKKISAFDNDYRKYSAIQSMLKIIDSS